MYCVWWFVFICSCQPFCCLHYFHHFASEIAFYIVVDICPSFCFHFQLFCQTELSTILSPAVTNHLLYTDDRIFCLLHLTTIFLSAIVYHFVFCICPPFCLLHLSTILLSAIVHHFVHHCRLLLSSAVIVANWMQISVCQGLNDRSDYSKRVAVRKHPACPTTESPITAQRWPAYMHAHDLSPSYDLQWPCDFPLSKRNNLASVEDSERNLRSWVIFNHFCKTSIYTCIVVYGNSVNYGWQLTLLTHWYELFPLTMMKLCAFVL